MAPVKFDDIPKTSNEVLNDDYFPAGYQLKAKQKTSFNGAVFSSQVDLFPKGGDKIVTPSKLTWKFPTPLGCTAFCIDKLEVDKSGGLKLEASSDKAYPKLKLECKSDLADINKIVGGLTYTGLADTQLKLETKPTNPQDFTCEVTRAQGPATLGLKYAASTGPDVGVRFTQGPFFASVLAKGAGSSFVANGFYKASDNLKCACTYTALGKQNGNFAVGVAYDVKKGTTIKAKVQQDQSVTVNVKHALAKGFTVVGGGKYDTAKGSFGYGVQLSVE
eukprot:TRINITY_DN288_c0_g2_i1.p1 TRINITY_DN288_c0_g2~~TRINITY_DN288_c0_g2_i1.p1  ORF type:complete len:276 (+),score=86.03 TRINITY_DN288_c0_g2_i1:76-903(+)